MVRAFVERGPPAWRCHGITHFRHRVLEPAFDAAAALVLDRSRTDVLERDWTRLHEQAATTVVYTSSLLLTKGDGDEDVRWELMHLAHQPSSASSRGSRAGLTAVVAGGWLGPWW